MNKKREESGLFGLVLMWVFVALMVVGTVFLVINAPRERALSCSRSDVLASLHSFGTCTEK